MSLLIAAWPRLMRPDIAAEYVGGETMFSRLVAQGLKATVQGKKLTVYDRASIDAAVDRYEPVDAAAD